MKKNKTELLLSSRNLPIIVVIVVAIIFLTLVTINNPFYIVTSGSMLPTLVQDDVVVISAIPFDDLQVGDIIAFHPTMEGLDMIFIHRIVEINIENNERVIKTKGDNSGASREGIDYPITSNEYVGKMLFALPQLGVVSTALSPPTNYVIIFIIIIAAFLVKFHRQLFSMFRKE